MKKEYDNPAAPGLYECAHINNIKMLSYEDFIEQFRSMTTEELNKFDLDYSYTHHKQISLSNIYILWKNNNFWGAKRYSLVDKCNPSKRALREGKLVTVNADIFIRSLTQSFINKYGDEAKKLYAPDWCKCIRNAGNECISDIICFCPLSPKQIGISPTADYRVEYIWIAIPDVKDNIDLLKQAAALYGYHLHKKEYDNTRRGTFDTNWVILTFAPDFQAYADKKIFIENNYFYHLSPRKHEEKIMKYGLCPRSTNNSYDYPPRVYMLREQGDFFGKQKVLTTREILNLSKELAESRLMFGKNENVNEYLYTVYRIKTADIVEINSKRRENSKIHFSYDMDFYPLGIFTSSNIPYSAIEIIGHFDSRDEEITEFGL